LEYQGECKDLLFSGEAPIQGNSLTTSMPWRWLWWTTIFKLVKLGLLLPVPIPKSMKMKTKGGETE
jgi:hypothetical protein